MELIERASALQRLGLIDATEDPKALAAKAMASKDLVNAEKAPATALLLAAGKVLELGAEAEEIGPEDYAEAIAATAEFLRGVVTIEGVVVKEDEDDPSQFSVKMTVNGERTGISVQDLGDMLDLAFLIPIASHLEEKGEKRILCPLVELMDDTARYILADPAAVEKAELDEVITAPDFELEEE